VRRFAEELGRNPWRLAAVLLVFGLFITNIYRAATQSIAHDEGVLFEWFLPGGFTQALDVQHGNHHVLHDLLCKLTVSLFGPSQVALRIPALLGGALYFCGVLAMSGLLFGSGFLFLLAVALLSLNPFVLDYLSCARGYSPALGFFVFGLYYLMRFLALPEDAASGRQSAGLLHRAGVALGLSVGCNVIMIFPAGALTAVFLGIVLADVLVRQPVQPAAVATPPATAKKERRPRKERRQAAAVKLTRSWGFVVVHFALPAVVIGGFFSALPKRLIELEEGYLGPPSLIEILRPLVRFSLFHSPSGFAGLAGWIPAESLVQAVTTILVPAGLLALVVAGIWIAIRWVRLRSFDALAVIDRFLLLMAGTLPLGILLIVISRYAFQQPYPEMRTVMYWLPLFSLAALGLVEKMSLAGTGFRYASAALAALLALVAVQFATQFNTRYFAEWTYCAAGKDMMRIVRNEHARAPSSRVRLGATWQLEPVINFYRVSWGMDWTDPVYRDGPNDDYDYYLLTLGDLPLIEQRGLQVLLRDKLSGSALARRPGL
jgi:hypothetical protein